MLIAFQLFIATFKPMLHALKFLVSPTILPTDSQATQKYLSDPIVLQPYTSKCNLVLRKLRAEYLSEILDETKPPRLDLLEGDIIKTLDESFSQKMSATMYLFGSTEEKEIGIYRDAIDLYWVHTRKEIEKVVAQLLHIYQDDVEKAILMNMPTKIRWLSLGFNPSNHGRLKVDTPSPPLTSCVCPSLMANWNTKNLGKRPKEQQINFGDVLAEVSHKTKYISIHVC